MVVFEFDGPVCLESVFDAAADKPATVGIGPVPTRGARDVHRSLTLHPTAAQFGEYKPAVIHETNAPCHRADPVVALRTQRRCWKGRVIETRPIEIAFYTNEKVTGLKIITGLDAANELGDTAIKIIAGNVQAAVRPSSAEVGTDIESGPVVGRRY